MTTILYEDPIFALHEVPSGHLERAERVTAIQQRLMEPPFGHLERGVAVPAELDDILAVHTTHYIERVRDSAPKRGIVTLDGDTFLSPRSYEAALKAAGAACQAVAEVFRGSNNSAFCIIRPPGHHASAARAMGFCIFNNAAIAARCAQRRFGAKRVAIVDWDVHHGNGTQEIFRDDPTVFYGSTHQMPLYPYTGYPTETGVGNIVNVALASGAKTEAFREGFEQSILPAMDRFSPELIVISAGFDGHWRDPLGGLALTADDFAWATERLTEVADKHCAGRIVSLLEGGYNIEGLVESAAAHVAALMH